MSSKSSNIEVRNQWYTNAKCATFTNPLDVRAVDCVRCPVADDCLIDALQHERHLGDNLSLFVTTRGGRMAAQRHRALVNNRFDLGAAFKQLVANRQIDNMKRRRR